MPEAVMTETIPDIDEVIDSLKIIRTKINPPHLDNDLVSRNRLFNRLDDSLHARLFLICAPAGYGKTMLAASWLGSRSYQTAWVSLDERDNDPVRFWAYLIAALQFIRHGIGIRALEMLQIPEPPSLESILTDLINELNTLDGENFIILDDYQAIHEPVIQNGVAFLLDHLPPQIHLLITSRVEPAFPLAQYRVRREMVQISMADLCFNLEEARTFFSQTMRVKIKNEDISILNDLTEGWVAGLQLAALSVQGDEDLSTKIRGFTGNQRYMFDYLAQEVLNRQSPTVNEFLLSTSILEQFNSSLCDALIPEKPSSQALIEELEKANLLIIPLDSERNWYRYHHLFSEFLQTRLIQSKTPAEIADLHRKAGKWYEQNYFPGEAISHAVSSGDVQHASKLIHDDMYMMFANSELATLLGWLDLLPDEVLRKDLQLLMMSAWALLAIGRMDSVEERLTEIEKQLGIRAEEGLEKKADLTPSLKGTLAEISILRAILSFQRVDLAGVLACSQRSLEYLDEDVTFGLYQTRSSLLCVNTFNHALAQELSGNYQTAADEYSQDIELSKLENNFQLELLTTSHLGRIRCIQGKLHESRELYRRAQQIAETVPHHPSPMAGAAYAGEGNILYEWNQLELAESRLKYGIELGVRWANWESLLPGFLGLARIRMAQMDMEGAVGVIDELLELANQLKLDWAADAFNHMRMHIYARAGRKVEVEAWLKDAVNEVEGPVYAINESEMIALLQVLYQYGKIDSAAVLADKLEISASSGGRNGSLIEIDLMKALVKDKLGDREAAIQSLEKALQMAEPEGYLRVFMDQGNDLIGLLDALPANSPEKQYASAIKELIAGESRHIPHAAAKSAGYPGEILSVRELEVLSLMADGYSNQEIADRLFVSLNTVKTHIKKILSQLDVHNRTHAIARARELGLI
jgi:LuxR family maltose regulon positive regulatory protein